MSCVRLAPTSGSPMTRAAHGCMPRHGSCTGNRGFPPPTSAPRTSLTRLRSVGWNGMFVYRVPAIRTSSTKWRPSSKAIGTTRISDLMIARNSAFAPKQQTDSRATIFLSPTELRPEPFQERLLEQIALSRQQGHHRNLLVAATGTGKTVMAALDYPGAARDPCPARDFCSWRIGKRS